MSSRGKLMMCVQYAMRILIINSRFGSKLLAARLPRTAVHSTLNSCKYPRGLRQEATRQVGQGLLLIPGLWVHTSHTQAQGKGQVLRFTTPFLLILCVILAGLLYT